jgi:transcriptional regulator of acetoin/glycerol metabolism
MEKHRRDQFLGIFSCPSKAMTATASYAQGAPVASDDADTRIERLQQQLTEQNQQIETLRQAVAEQEARHRELQRAVVMTDQRLITPADLGLAVISSPVNAELDTARTLAEREAISLTLGRVGRNVTHAARELGISRMTLYRLMDKHGLARSAAKPNIHRQVVCVVKKGFYATSE